MRFSEPAFYTFFKSAGRASTMRVWWTWRSLKMFLSMSRLVQD